MQPNLVDPPLKALKMAHLRLMAEVQAAGQLGLAAERLGISQPAASRLLAEAERLSGQRLHHRDGRGLRLTAAGGALAQRAARILLELTEAAREMAEAGSGNEGHVRIGAVTGPALSRVLPSLRALGAAHPGLSFEVAVATSDQLCDRLLAGRLDFVIGRLPDPAQARSLTIEMIDDEPIALIVRRGHPLLMRASLRPVDTLEFDWVMPEPESLLARTVIRQLTELGLPQPRRQVSTSSFLFTLAMLTQTDAVAPLAAAVADGFAVGPTVPFIRLPLEIDLRVEPYGLIRRRGGHLTPAALRLAEAMMQG